VRQNGQGLKKPRVRAGLFRIPIPPSGALPPGGMETLPDAAKTRLQHISFFCCRGLMTAQPEIHKLWLSQIKKSPAAPTVVQIGAATLPPDAVPTSRPAGTNW